MQPEATPTAITVSRSGICVVGGYGAKIWVERGRLVVRDVLEGQPREARFARATAGIRRLVLLGHTGLVTLEALRWLADVGVGFVHLDRDGRLLASSAGFGLDDPRLRRAQAMAWGTDAGLAIARELLQQKLVGQARVAAMLAEGDRTAEVIRELADHLDTASTSAELMVVEAAAANEYWSAWSGMGFPFVRRDVDRVPEHWLKFGPRASPVTGNPRSAANPGQAFLNYAYALLEAEARLACLAAGLDPGLGVLHADLKARDSLVLDVMEAARPEVDRVVLELVRREVFRGDDFVETRQGVCRLRPVITHRLAETLPLWRQHLAPVVERVAAAFAAGPGSRVAHLPTKLTEAKRSASRARHGSIRPRNASDHFKKQSPRCRSCGIDVSEYKRWCDSCRPKVFAEGANDALEVARQKRMVLRGQGRDPATSAQAKEKQRRARVERARELRGSTGRIDGRDATYFREYILPVIQHVPLSRLATATGLSKTYCSKIRAGQMVPHPRWWEVLRGAVAVPR